MTRSIDILDRQPFVEDLIKVVRLMADVHNCCTFAIDGRWGSGKTYILNLFEEQLNLFQHPVAAGDRYILFHYNCWQYDYYDEPAVAIISSIRDEILEYKKLFSIMPNKVKAVFEIAKDLGSELLGNVLETKLGWNPLDIWDKFKDNLSGMKMLLTNQCNMIHILVLKVYSIKQNSNYQIWRKINPSLLL